MQAWKIDFKTNMVTMKHCVISVPIRVFSGSYFPVFRLNTEVYLSQCSVPVLENTDKNFEFRYLLRSESQNEIQRSNHHTLSN